MRLEKVLILGAGTMGQGIATWFSQQNIKTHLTDQFDTSLLKAQNKIYHLWEKLLAKNKFNSKQIDQFKTNLKNIKLEEISSDYDLVIEAIIEDESIKKDLFSYLDKKVQDQCIFASNTSSLSINSLAQSVSAQRQNKFIGLHFFNPATIMKLVEIISSSAKTESLCLKLEQWFLTKSKQPAICTDSPGFIVNRVARSFYGEPLRFTEENEDSYQEIDDILKEVGGFKMGPFELMDLIGIDINYSVTCSVWESFDKNPRFTPHIIQENKVKNNYLGKKSGRGFYQYE